MNRPSGDAATSYKVVLIGDQRVGKTTLLSQWAHGEFREEYEATVSPELTTKEVNVAGKQVRLQVWDIGFGEPLTASQFPLYLKGASGALLLYDLTKNSSIDELAKWQEQVREVTPACAFVVVGCKSDQAKDYILQRARAFSQGINVEHVETCAMRGDAATPFESIARALQGITAKPPVPQAPTASDNFKKLVLLGESGVGKSSLVLRLSGEGGHAVPEDYMQTAGPEILTRQVVVNGASLKLQIWDAPGSDLMMPKVSIPVLQNVDVAFIVYDVTSRASFDSVNRWLRLLEAQAKPGLAVMILANKTDDLARVVSEATGRARAEALRVPFAECSARCDADMSGLLDTLLQGGRSEPNWEAADADPAATAAAAFDAAAARTAANGLDELARFNTSVGLGMRSSFLSEPSVPGKSTFGRDFSETMPSFRVPRQSVGQRSNDGFGKDLSGTTPIAATLAAGIGESPNSSRLQTPACEDNLRPGTPNVAREGASRSSSSPLASGLGSKTMSTSSKDRTLVLSPRGPAEPQRSDPLPKRHLRSISPTFSKTLEEKNQSKQNLDAQKPPVPHDLFKPEPKPLLLQERSEHGSQVGSEGVAASGSEASRPGSGSLPRGSAAGRRPSVQLTPQNQEESRFGKEVYIEPPEALSPLVLEPVSVGSGLQHQVGVRPKTVSSPLASLGNRPHSSPTRGDVGSSQQRGFLLPRGDRYSSGGALGASGGARGGHSASSNSSHGPSRSISGTQSGGLRGQMMGNGACVAVSNSRVQPLSASSRAAVQRPQSSTQRVQSYKDLNSSVRSPETNGQPPGSVVPLGNSTAFKPGPFPRSVQR